ncbi:hypothetical protein LJ207_03425 [Halanaerobium sp. Z-7514]|uniref:Methyltransferase domain-containing protein n=1 Tax=Halanaerobium polyolivorans TaxID=2886943 RepID=A0AAW4WZE8_9FIRM|nr:hypothetical protein [Halanaerobium polyolivorans]MCC3144369.1 hypothetical protein [Halanaerobium polyolivorans]RQD75328.1 MAG: hypothetical protein D5S01_05380 [Halanaerobium sp. MSAO_Bac5]
MPAKNLISNFKESFHNKACKALQKLEASFNKINYTGYLYDKFFYNRLIAAELELAELKRGSKILHIGSGPRPMTAVYLARQGYFVDGLEIDPEARQSSCSYLNELEVKDKIEILAGNGKEIDYSKYAAIWLSLHVKTKKELLQEISKKALSGTKIIYRNPASWLLAFYDEICPRSFTNINHCRETPLIKAKRSCVLEVN